MRLVRFAASAVIAIVFSMPFAVQAQESHEDAAAQTHAHDKHHHTKAKFVGGGAAGGAAVGAVAGGPVGAVVGGGIGAAGGAVANKVHRHKEIQKREETETPQQ